MQFMKRDDTSHFTNSRYVKELTPDNFDATFSFALKSKDTNRGCGILLFYAPWCGYCKETFPIFEEAAKLAGFCDFYAFNCEKYKDHVSKIKEEMPNLIQGYPTIVVYKNGTPILTHDGDRSVASIVKLCMNTCKKMNNNITN